MKKLAFLFSLFLLFGCPEKDCFRDYLFEIPFSVTITDTLHIGDTISVSSVIPTRLEDQRNGGSVDVGPFNFLTEMIAVRFDSIYQEDVLPRFSIVEKEGEVEILTFHGSISGRLLYTNAENSQHFSASLIPHVPGRYYIGFFSFYHEGNNISEDFFNREVSFSDNDCSERLYITYQTVASPGNNFHLMAENQENLPRSLSEEDFQSIGGFAFIVTASSAYPWAVSTA